VAKPIRYLRKRLAYSAATATVIALGLASRAWPALFPSMLGKYPGDALWGMMVFFGMRVVRPTGSIAVAVVLALSVSWLDEFSQVYQAPWINAIRSNPIGHLFLGYTFSWFDMLAYTIGIAIGALIALVMRTWFLAPE
jgi:hypothetical protein